MLTHVEFLSDDSRKHKTRVTRPSAPRCSAIAYVKAAPCSMSQPPVQRQNPPRPLKQTKHFFALRCPGVNLRSFACACCFMRSDDPAELLFRNTSCIPTPIHTTSSPRSQVALRSEPTPRNRSPFVRSPLSPRPIQQRHILFDTQRQKALVAGSQATLARLSSKTLSLIDRQRSQPRVARYQRTASLAGRFTPSRQLLRR